MEYAIEFKNVTKSFGTVFANHNVTLGVTKGEILSLLGENGSGKTSLMNLVAGIYYPDAGEIFVNGEKREITSPHDSLELGIGMIHQHFKLIDVFNGVENIALTIPKSEKYDIKAVRKKAEEICKKYGFELDLSQKVYNMSVSQKQTLEIVKVLYRGADILILDEPTAVLTMQETQKLFNVIRLMKKDGKTVVIITHKLNEVMEISDKVSVLRRGEFVGTVATCDTNEKALTEMMVGEKIDLNIERPVVDNKQKRLEISHLSAYNDYGVQVLHDISFDVYGGEILGIAGVSGNGQKELLEAIAGLQPTVFGSSVKYYPEKGSLHGAAERAAVHESIAGDRDEGEPQTLELIGKTPRLIRDAGIHLSFVPEDRLGMGLVASMGMPGNMMLKSYRNGNSIFIDKKEPTSLAREIKDSLSVVTPDVDTPVSRLSGGNVQKVLVGREIAQSPAVLMTAYAVRGLDINTSYTIYHLLNQQKKNGVAVIYVGEDIDVLMELCDRIVVLCDGHVNGILDGSKASKEEIGLLMTNLKKEGA